MSGYATAPTAGDARLPRVTVEYCTQCRWLLRAAYYAQELLSTFSTSLGQVALQPSTGGVFIVTIHTATADTTAAADTTTTTTKHVLWDRKINNGFPETKLLKRLVRDVVEPDRHLGHVDGHDQIRPTTQDHDQSQSATQNQDCLDCN